MDDYEKFVQHLLPSLRINEEDKTSKHSAASSVIRFYGQPILPPLVWIVSQFVHLCFNHNESQYVVVITSYICNETPQLTCPSIIVLPLYLYVSFGERKGSLWFVSFLCCPYIFCVQLSDQTSKLTKRSSDYEWNLKVHVKEQETQLNFSWKCSFEAWMRVTSQCLLPDDNSSPGQGGWRCSNTEMLLRTLLPTGSWSLRAKWPTSKTS